METLRLYPPISGLNKVPPKGGIQLSGYHIPEGTLISVSSEKCLYLSLLERL